MTKVVKVSPYSPDVKKLIAELDEDSNCLYPDATGGTDALEELSKDNVIFLAAFENCKVIACGAIKFLPEGYAELKSMYVCPHQRRRGLAKHLLDLLEAKTKKQGVSIIRLETGHQRLAARGLYRAMGFKESRAFGHYSKNSKSIFMEKKLNT